jgi:opacity protein-like surface antigen
MSNLRLSLALAALLFPGAAIAADMPDIGFAPPPEVQEFGSNWYLRGDVGYVWHDNPSLAVGGVTEQDIAWGPYKLGGVSFDDSWSAGFGFGVKATDWLRFDLTADYRSKSDFSGNTLGTTFSGSADSWILLANAYLDLGTWSGITPYVGAGIGAAGVTPSGVNDGIVTADFDSQWAFAWGLMAGASIALSPNWAIDVGYRYVAIDDMDFRDAADNQLQVRDQSSQEVRIGARYLID